MASSWACHILAIYLRDAAQLRLNYGSTVWEFQFAVGPSASSARGEQAILITPHQASAAVWGMRIQRNKKTCTPYYFLYLCTVNPKVCCTGMLADFY